MGLHPWLWRAAPAAIGELGDYRWADVDTEQLRPDALDALITSTVARVASAE